MAYTIEQYNALSESIAMGALIVEYSDKKVTYRSLADMLRIQALMAGELGLNANKSGLAANRTYTSFSSGMNSCDESGTKYGAQ